MVVPNSHSLHQSGGNFRMSPLLQELACYLGQDQVFDRASETFEKLMGVKLCDRAIDRVSHYYGEQIETLTETEIQDGTPILPADPDVAHYVMMDGGMVFTRERRWMEMKLARIFPVSTHLSLHKNRNWVKESRYVAHLGEHKRFLPKLEQHTDEIDKLIFINDGARWIWKWVESNYPDSIQILDFFHAKEHLCEFAIEYFHSKAQRTEWIELQSKLLMNDQVEKVIENIRSLATRKSKKIEKHKKELLGYYRKNVHRMKYKSFKDSGYMIGSGPIEAAHRHVIQQRMKLSGQRWTIKGAQQIVNLRTANKSNQWEKVVKLIRKAA